MPQLTPHQKLFVTIGVILAALLIVVYEGVFTQLGVFKDLKREYKRLGEEKSRLAYQKDQAIKLEKEQSLLQERGHNLSNIFLPEEDLVEFIGAAEQAARNQNISMRIQPRVNVRGSGKGFAFQVNALGTFAGTARFIDQLQNLGNVVAIENVSIRSEGRVDPQTGELISAGKVAATVDIFVPIRE